MKTLSVYGNPNYAGPWSVKALGQEHEFTKYDNIRQNGTSGMTSDLSTRVGSSVGSNGCTNIAPYTMTFENPGNHLVRLYNTYLNVYNLWFWKDNNITSAWIDWSGIDLANQFGYKITFQFCGNLKSIWYGNPDVPNQYLTPDIQNCSNLESVVLSNPGAIKVVGSSYLFNSTNLTQVQAYPNATNFLASTFRNCINLRYYDMSSAKNIGANTFSMSSFQKPQNGLYKVRIGDCIQSFGQNAFYACKALTEIEFLCDDEDWISTWNSNQALTKWSGQIAQQGEDPDVARFVEGTIATKDGVQWTGDNIPSFASITVRRIRRSSN